VLLLRTEGAAHDGAVEQRHLELHRLSALERAVAQPREGRAQRAGLEVRRWHHIDE